MKNEVLIALLTKLVDERLSQLPDFSSCRGPRGPAGRDGKDFDFSEHEEKIKSWAKEFALRFEDLTSEQINSLRGRDGQDGKDGRDGKDFSWDSSGERISQIIKSTVEEMSGELKLKFSDLSDSDIEKIKGPKGLDGRDGKGFIWDENRERISEIIRSTVEEMSENLKLRFSDLEAEDIERIRGPRGRDGRDGRDFNFEEHREFFEGLKLKFSDLSEEEKESLRLKFSDLSEEEKESLKLRFKDLTPEDIALIRGPRGMRGQRGMPGRDGDSIVGPAGPRGLPGVIGPRGFKGDAGRDGRDGKDGNDAPRIIDISIEQMENEIEFVFTFSDGNIIRSSGKITELNRR